MLALRAEFGDSDGPEPFASFVAQQLEDETMLLVLAWDGDRAVGCGADETRATVTRLFFYAGRDNNCSVNSRKAWPASPLGAARSKKRVASAVRAVACCWV